ncbi:hypothetical protein [Ekhidna sp.]|uniref:hypothetical protein n=1 Tax=Ekhidna sp. TaxID=2608089 RepID=UPI003299118F
MKTRINLLVLSLWVSFNARSQELIPIDTNNWKIQARAYVLEKHMGTDAIYLQAGAMTLKDKEFKNGIIEFDIHLKKEQAFPGVYFRANNTSGDSEQFYVRPHQSGNPDANQAAPTTKNISPWQLYFGPKYSFPYEYNYDTWTHIKILVNEENAQIFMDHSDKPNLSWKLFHKPESGKIILRGGNSSGFHIANIKISSDTPELIDFKPVEREAIPSLIQEWEVSDMFEEKLLHNPNDFGKVLENRSWQGKIQVEEGTAANISRIQNLRDGTPGNTVLAKITITSDKDQIKLFEFGYSDRVVAILNGEPIYWGNNKWRSRDYRYLGTVGLFDGIYLNLQKGKNELLMAVSEDFGGWLITGRFTDSKGIKIK